MVIGFATSSANAQYVNRYITITSGAVTFTGNTLRLSKGTNTNTPGTNGSIGTFITNDTSIRDNTYPLGTTADWTKNRSEATLVIPTGATVKYAELIWGGSYAHPTGATASAENVKASIDSSGDRSILERAVRQYESFCQLRSGQHKRRGGTGSGRLGHKHSTRQQLEHTTRRRTRAGRTESVDGERFPRLGILE